ncbi:MAG: anti-sigma factor [Acetobacteraceae bacterium]|nr:anti-sigma factor [Acetobacteraceae bacterium]
MECRRVWPWLPLVEDGGLGAWRRWRLRSHLRGCAGCAAKLEEMRAMRAAVREKLTYHAAPPALAARVGAALAREAVPMHARRFHWPGLPSGGVLLLGSGATGALAGVALMLLVQGNGAGGPSALDAVIDSHVRSMMADHLTDVQTSDRHTVKPWLSAHIDVSPPVKELAAQGFPLVGGRLDYVDGHPAAVVVYRSDRHVINLFAWAAPGQADAPMRTEARQGFNVVTWRAGGLAFTAVSDVEPNRLMAFARDVAGGAG